MVRRKGDDGGGKAGDEGWWCESRLASRGLPLLAHSVGAIWSAHPLWSAGGTQSFLLVVHHAFWCVRHFIDFYLLQCKHVIPNNILPYKFMKFHDLVLSRGAHISGSRLRQRSIRRKILFRICLSTVLTLLSLFPPRHPILHGASDMLPGDVSWKYDLDQSHNR